MNFTKKVPRGFTQIIRNIDEYDLEQWIIQFEDSIYELLCEKGKL